MEAVLNRCDGEGGIPESACAGLVLCSPKRPLNSRSTWFASSEAMRQGSGRVRNFELSQLPHDAVYRVVGAGALTLKKGRAETSTSISEVR